MFLTRDQIREVDRRAIEEFGIPGIVLMENAGRSCAELLRGLGIAGRVTVCCGKGNNGGDGFVIARHLDNWGVPVRVLLFARPDHLTGDAQTNFAILHKSGLPIIVHEGPDVDRNALRRELGGAAWVVDALFGTGLGGPLRAPFDGIVEAVNGGPAQVLAVDLPSGLDCGTGLPVGPTVRAHHTATFVALKKGFAVPGAKEWVGQVHVIDIGVPRAVLQAINPAPCH
jgi:NAD(P)H-hydrate epimerase